MWGISDSARRYGYTGFWSFMILMWKLDRKARKYGVREKHTIELPLKSVV